MSRVQVLLAEDNPGDVFLISEALRAHDLEFDLHVLSDGAQALQYLDRMGALDATYPDIFLLDLNIPKGDGHEILQSFRSHPKGRTTPVVVVTSSGDPRDLARAEQLGATSYFRKPSDLDEFLKLGALVASLIAGNRAVDGSPSPTR